MKKLKLLIYIFTLILYEEIIFSILTVPNTDNVILKIIFILLITLIIETFIKIFKEKHRNIVATVLISLISILHINKKKELYLIKKEALYCFH